MDIEHQILFSVESLTVDENETPKLDVLECIKLIPRNLAIWYGLAIANYTQDDDIRVQLETLQFGPEVKRFVEAVLATKQFDEKYILCKPQTGLELLKYAFSIPKEAYISGSKAPFPLLASILIINSRLLANNAHWQDNSISRSSKLIRSKGYEIDERVPIFATVFRMFCLLYFLEQSHNNKWAILRDALVVDLRCQTLREYFRGILDVLDRLTIGPKKKHQVLKVKEDNYILQNFIGPLSICGDAVVQLQDNRDYTFFKTHPFVQFNHNEYGIINNTFVANQLYSSLKFRMKTVGEKTEIIKDFFASFNKAFVEKYLLNEVLKCAFGQNSGAIYLNEDDCESRIKEYNYAHNSNVSTMGLPDAYIRSDNKILLIECKGKTVSSNAIEDENTFIADVNKDIVNENKGTGQLITYCESVKNGAFICDENIPSNCKIYPLLVVDDAKLCSDGLNRYAIQWKEKNGTSYDNVYPFTVLDMDTLILIADLIKNGELDLYEQIEQYHKYIAGEYDNYSLTEILHYSDISFSAYIMDKFETRSPAIINDWLKALYANRQ